MTDAPADPHVRRRIVMLLTTEFTWGLGFFFVLPATTIATFLNARGAAPVVIGVMATAMGALPLLLQLFGRQVMQRLGHGQRSLALLHIPVIAPYFLVALADAALGGHPRALVAVTIALLAVSQVCLGLIVPVWLDLLARVIPLAYRGRYFGLASAAFAIGGILGGVALTVLEQRLGGAVYRAAFLLAGVLFTISITVLACAPLPEAAFIHDPEPPLWVRSRRAFGACRPATDFGKLVWSYAAMILASSLMPFLVVYATDARLGLGYPEGVFSRITLLQAIGGAVGSVCLGWMVDHHGPRWPWVAATLFMPAVAVLYPYAGHWAILAACSVMCGALTTHWSVSGPALLELSPEGDKSGYVAAANMIGFVPAAVGPILFGGLIEHAGYTVTFIAAGVCGIAAIAPAMAIRGRDRRGAE